MWDVVLFNLGQFALTIGGIVVLIIAVLLVRPIIARFIVKPTKRALDAANDETSRIMRGE